jgi:hypothetical protein
MHETTPTAEESRRNVKTVSVERNFDGRDDHWSDTLAVVLGEVG